MKQSKNNNPEKEGEEENMLLSSLKMFHWKYKQGNYDGQPRGIRLRKKIQ